MEFDYRAPDDCRSLFSRFLLWYSSTRPTPSPRWEGTWCAPAWRPGAGFLPGQRTAAALKAKGYRHRFVFSLDTGHCDGRVFEQTLADTLVWVWRGYHAG